MTLIKVSALPLTSRDPRVWKPFYKRLKGMAKIRGHPFVRCLPGLEWTYFDGKRFRDDTAHVVFEFGDSLQEAHDHNHFIDKLKSLPEVKIEVFTSKERYWKSLQ